MKLLNVYYRAKPSIPHNIRLAMRGYIASQKRRRSAHVWPINPVCAEPPKWFHGWPHGKKFAFVLTHDVEGQRGYDRCQRLAEVEMRHGFHSSFNFVPEGEYSVSTDLREFLGESGFEVGVHDLHHDGSLYRSKEDFFASAVRINQHLKEWDAVGFRSGFMFHNLEWLKQLDVLYDASTFDTDPFEPQSDGANTIFPFWVPRSDGSGYIELPYSLAQDSTMYLVLREQSNEIWKRKLDWVAQQGGMALLNVHPDYIAFDGDPARTEYPVSLYADFLEYVSTHYGDVVWHALPRDVARFAKGAILSGTNSEPGAQPLAETVK
ncbi:MAG TPA: hypothetical protein VG893_05375 [Terracidiphilus sp.]|nr:hypothetical protein [Terracidiphilus sp.]